MRRRRPWSRNGEGETLGVRVTLTPGVRWRRGVSWLGTGQLGYVICRRIDRGLGRGQGKGFEEGRLVGL